MHNSREACDYFATLLRALVGAAFMLSMLLFGLPGFLGVRELPVSVPYEANEPTNAEGVRGGAVRRIALSHQATHPDCFNANGVARLASDLGLGSSL
ncbi:MAG: hypothetical protein ACFCVA_02905 [Gammaproteobacteria bacterium]